MLCGGTIPSRTYDGQKRSEQDESVVQLPATSPSEHRQPLLRPYSTLFTRKSPASSDPTPHSPPHPPRTPLRSSGSRSPSAHPLPHVPFNGHRLFLPLAQPRRPHQHETDPVALTSLSVASWSANWAAMLDFLNSNRNAHGSSTNESPTPNADMVTIFLTSGCVFMAATRFA